jgi:hypothetical protein
VNTGRAAYPAKPGNLSNGSSAARKSDQSWLNRKLLLTGAEHQSARQWRRFTTMLDTADPTGEIGDASRRRGQPRTAHLDRQQVGEGRTGEE